MKKRGRFLKDLSRLFFAESYFCSRWKMNPPM